MISTHSDSIVLKDKYFYMASCQELMYIQFNRTASTLQSPMLDFVKDSSAIEIKNNILMLHSQYIVDNQLLADQDPVVTTKIPLKPVDMFDGLEGVTTELDLILIDETKTEELKSLKFIKEENPVH